MEKIIQAIQEYKQNFEKIVCSDAKKEAPFVKIVLRMVQGKSGVYVQAEQYTREQVFHKNIPMQEFLTTIKPMLAMYKQIVLIVPEKTMQFYILPNGKLKTKVFVNHCSCVVPQTHNKEKNYILLEGEDIPALRDLGVFTATNQVVKSMYDKYKQINKFIEIVDEALKNENVENFTILDFGCGKSYLTFILYYYFTKKRNMPVRIIGYDLKQDVVTHCNVVAQKYGYTNLTFQVSDVSKDTLSNEKIDMVISLYACNTATDYALNYAIVKKVPYIFSVPCCQHEINESIQKGGDFDILLEHGLFKERFSALLTDAVRVKILQAMGYVVDVIEFVDLAHSPKNVMLRAKKQKAEHKEKLKDVQMLLEKYAIKQTLFELIQKE